MENIIIIEAKSDDAKAVLDFRYKVYGETEYLLNTSEEFNHKVEKQEIFLRDTEKRVTGCFFLLLMVIWLLGSLGLTGQIVLECVIMVSMELLY